VHGLSEYRHKLMLRFVWRTH